MSEEEEWTTPSSSALEEASIELGIEPISAPEVGSSLTEVNAVVRKSGLSCLARDQSVNIFYSRHFFEFFFIFFLVLTKNSSSMQSIHQFIITMPHLKLCVTLFGML